MRKVKFPLTRGFRDFYPKQMIARKWLFGKMREVSRRFGYQEYEGPALESLALYAAKSGEELVKRQTFILKDRSGKKLALRPELTPTLARMVAQKQGELVEPLRWFSIGPRWRYETPQKGRAREFYQWDVDLIGVEPAEADAEVIAVAAEFFKSIGLLPKQVVIKINNRRFLEQKLDLIEIPNNKIQAVFRAIDKKNKMAGNEWETYLKEIGLNKLQIKDLWGILKDKDFGGESEELTILFSTLQDLGVADYVEFDPTIVRGLDYYTGTVFEAQDKKGEFRAILGGGRYDNLVEVVGGPAVGGVGFACGDIVLEEVLKKFNFWPDLNPIPTKVLVTIFDESLYREAIQFSRHLREAKIPTELYLTPVKLDKQLKYADKKGIPFVAILGPNEAKNKTVTLKNLKTRKQQTILQTKAIQKLAA
ncbi:histidine--tRNA ligase [Candidatus Shapirobacteria bacterium CG10_big_fil_rev_8_21_14_0_10_38_14]|uniref:Histidine--tRNA ligase n=1 Tax=Candidatus Shapirobacteria bacterium CG10_big_fil_rev_8_21_14_0_10_38_14 TaxID=1974483 RepID=A0A2M8L4Z4_9BACT|nr:MAG: histidine--tRNA ligase [Candidatus Shapirobacteria bacterium CG10_big_fil_rev_8_21_14_0_10_38_14]